MMNSKSIVLLCPGQGAQAVGMGRPWCDASEAARKTFAEAEALLRSLPAPSPWRDMKPLRELCVDGPAPDLDRTDVSQPALFVCGIASFRALRERGDLSDATDASSGGFTMRAAAGLSLGEYTALVLAGAISFEDGLRLVAERGRLMQRAAEASKGGMVALIGAEEAQADAVCADAAQGEVLVCANFNAPGQIVLSGHATACDRAEKSAAAMGLRASRLKVAGAFHSPLMAPAAEGLAGALEPVEIRVPGAEVWSNVTARPHDGREPASIRKRLVEQLVSPVRWSQSCEHLIATVGAESGVSFHELAPGTVLKGLMRRINRSVEVTSHDQPAKPGESQRTGQRAPPSGDEARAAPSTR